VPLPPRLELQMNLAKNWSKWRQVWTAHQMVTNIALQPSLFCVAAFIACTGPNTLCIHNSELDTGFIEFLLLSRDQYYFERFDSTITTKHQMNLVVLILLLFEPWLLDTILQICETSSFEAEFCVEFQTSKCSRISFKNLNSL